MRGNKLEKSYIHILESETLSRESGVTESAQEVVDSTLKITDSRPISTFVKSIILLLVVCFTRMWGFYLEVV